jgi:hypothetical protein
VTLDEALALYEESEPPVDQAWRELCIATVGLGAALARFDTAAKAYGEVKTEGKVAP